MSRNRDPWKMTTEQEAALRSLHRAQRMLLAAVWFAIVTVPPVLGWTIWDHFAHRPASPTPVAARLAAPDPAP